MKDSWLLVINSKMFIEHDKLIISRDIYAVNLTRKIHNSNVMC